MVSKEGARPFPSFCTEFQVHPAFTTFLVLQMRASVVSCALQVRPAFATILGTRKEGKCGMVLSKLVQFSISGVLH